MIDWQNDPEFPDWRDTSVGARVRVAAWLVSVVGEGNEFTKQQLRKAIPDREQVDRRMRDLRPAGWVIKTYRDKQVAGAEILHLEKVGLPVWQKQYRGAGLRTISDKLRREVYERDKHRCVRCGTAAREIYLDPPHDVARLTLGHVNPHKLGSAATIKDLVTECARCNEAVRHLTGVQVDAERVWDQIVELPKRDKTRLLRWMAADSRDFDKAEQVWAIFRQLPGASREELHERLKNALES
ncbi:HNH endonuclease [Streptomyces sp. NPDC000994]